MQRPPRAVDDTFVLLDLLFPPVCVGCGVLVAADLGGASGPAPTCTRCTAEVEPLAPELAVVDGIAAVATYGGPFAAALARLKYGGQAALAGPLGRLLATAPALADARAAWDVVTAVPLHRLRLFARGYDQAELLVRSAVRERAWLRRALVPRLLVRTRSTLPQTRLDAAGRERNVENAFAVRRPLVGSRAGRVAGARILVVDDVTTTGATLRACVRALERADAAEVGALALLRAVP